MKTLIGNMDAKIWAEEFVKLVKTNPSIATDEAIMLGWFANAIMTGYDIDFNRRMRQMNDIKFKSREGK